MKSISTLLILTIFTITSCGQKYKYPGQLQIKTYKIGDRVDTTQFKKYSDLYLPNYLDGWTMDNVSHLPEKYFGLPVAIWQSKEDSSIALTLLDDIILNISVSYLTDVEKLRLQNLFTDKFGCEAKQKSYEQTHPLQDWITYWNLQTWETKDAIVQIGNSEMRKPNQSPRKEISWNMVYSDFLLEDKVINNFKQKLFSNKEDSLKFVRKLDAHKNRMNPPRNGLFTDYADNGQLKEKGSYKNGKKNGLWETWFNNGQKEDSAIYKNDVLTGKRVMWHPNGQIQLESCWGKPDVRVGKWIRYYQNGQIESITNFDDKGNIIEDILYNEQGQKIN